VNAFANRDFSGQSVILRHVFGSQEAPRAHHLDGWSEKRFRAVLPPLGFEPQEFAVGYSGENGLLASVVVRAKPESGSPREARVRAARMLLRAFMNGDNTNERGLFARWESRLDELLEAQ
jgi:hypothetical protein